MKQSSSFKYIEMPSFLGGMRRLFNWGRIANPIKQHSDVEAYKADLETIGQDLRRTIEAYKAQIK